MANLCSVHYSRAINNLGKSHKTANDLNILWTSKPQNEDTFDWIPLLSAWSELWNVVSRLEAFCFWLRACSRGPKIYFIVSDFERLLSMSSQRLSQTFSLTLPNLIEYLDSPAKCKHNVWFRHIWEGLLPTTYTIVHARITTVSL